MPNPGTISGTHHLTFCVGGAQEDYDFHVRTLGLKSVKKTVLFDGEIPIYHLYYANRVGDASTILTRFPYRQAGWMGRRGTNQAKSINVAVPGRVDRLLGRPPRERRHRRRARPSASAPQRLEFAHPCGIPYQIVGETGEDDARALRRRRRARRARDPRRVRHDDLASASPSRWTSSCARRSTPSTLASEGAHHQYEIGTGDGHGRMLELVEEPDLPQGTWRFGEGTIHHHAFDVGTAENQAARSRTTSSASATPTSPTSRTAATSSPSTCARRAARCSSSPTRPPQGFTIDESEDELGTHMCIPPHWEDRRAEISQLEPIDTIENVQRLAARSRSAGPTARRGPRRAVRPPAGRRPCRGSAPLSSVARWSGEFSQACRTSRGVEPRDTQARFSATE